MTLGYKASAEQFGPRELLEYGVLAEASILDLFMAGILPSAIIAASYLGWIMLRAVMVSGIWFSTNGVQT